MRGPFRHAAHAARLTANAANAASAAGAAGAAGAARHATRTTRAARPYGALAAPAVGSGWSEVRLVAALAAVPLLPAVGGLLLAEAPPPPPVAEVDAVPQFAATAAARERRRRLVAEGGPMAQLLIGNAIGDAFGLGIEMEDAYWIREHVAFPPTAWPQRPRRPPWRVAPGMYSDDCEMTVGLMKGLTRDGLAITSAGMLAAWKEEWDLSAVRPPPADAGVPCPDGLTRRGGHGSITDYWMGKRSLQDVQQKQAAKVDPGNAPPMRSLPLAFIADASVRARLCRVSADATHPHPKARAASLLVAAAARWMVVRQGDRQRVVEIALAELRDSDLRESETETLLEAVERLPDWHSYGPRFQSMPTAVHNLLCGPQPIRTKALYPGDIDTNRCGLDSDAMRTAAVMLYVLKWHQGPLDALAASVDIGGDVDSTAALVLGIVGGSSGLQIGEPGGVPAFMVEEVEGVEYLLARAREFEAWLRSAEEGT